MSKLTEEEVKYNSIIATQDSLIKLGAQHQKQKLQIESFDIQYKKLEDEISNNMEQSILILKIEDILKHRIQNDRIDKFMELFKKYNDFYQMNKELITNLQEHNNKLEDEYHFIRAEYNETNKEYEEKHKYWTDRVTKLRIKCMDKNKIITELEQTELYNTYNIFIKNILLFFIGLFGLDLSLFFKITFFIFIIFCYSIYSNSTVL